MKFMKMLINGEWVSSQSGEEIKKINPSTGEVFGLFPAGTKEDVDRAIDAAEDSFATWSDTTSVERARILYRARDLIVAKREELENLLVS